MNMHNYIDIDWTIELIARNFYPMTKRLIGCKWKVQGVTFECATFLCVCVCVWKSAQIHLTDHF